MELRTKGIITSTASQQQIAAGGSAMLGAGKIAQLESQLKQAKVCNIQGYFPPVKRMIFKVFL